MNSETNNPTSDSKPLTIVDVARLLGVSKSTVSAAFTGGGNISAGRRESVRLAAQRLGYTPNPHAQRLIQGRCQSIINVIGFGLDLGIGTQTIREIQWRISERGYDAPINILGNLERDATHHGAEFRALRLQRPRAMILSSNGLTADSALELSRYQEDGGYILCYNDQLPAGLECDFVEFDQRDSMIQAARHLLEAGHRKLGISFPGPYDTTHPRYRGFCDALAEYGLAPRPNWVFQNINYEMGGVDLAAQFLSRRDRPTAMCVINDVVAATFVYHLGHHGIRVPDAVSVVSLDDAPAAAACTVPLTAVSYPIQAIVRQIIEQLFLRIDGKDVSTPKSFTIQGDLIPRQSVRAPSS